MSDASDSRRTPTNTAKETLSTRSRLRFYAVGLKMLIVFYACWLGWLAYVAWVNIQAGNQ